MTAKQIYLVPLAAILLLAVSLARAAESDTVQVAIPWDAEGQVFQANTTTLVFLGSMKGVVYVEKSSGEMNEGFIVCPIVQQLNLESGKTLASGHCEITASAESVLYAKLACEGKIGGGGCEGEFTLTDGEGKFTGISGSGKLRVRSPIRALVTDLASGSTIRIGSGLAQIKDLKYKIP